MDKNSLLWSINRIKAEFSDEIGNVRTTVGTGFWLNTDSYLKEFCFVTNRHNLDAAWNGMGDKFTLRHVEIELRKFEKLNSWSSSTILTSETEYFVIENNNSIFFSQDADCAVIKTPSFKDLKEGFQVFTQLRLESLATKSFFDSDLNVTDSCHFIGFPSDKKNKLGWWDHKYNSPIARFASIASSPKSYHSFSHPSIKSNDIILVTGLSFSGSSGSPVISDQKGIGSDFKNSTSTFIHKVQRGPSINTTYSHSAERTEDAYNFIDENYRPSKIIGIMTGHCNIEVQEKMEHSGLSYLTRSSSICELFKRMGYDYNQNGLWHHKNSSISTKLKKAE